MKNKILYIQYTNPACYPPLEHSSGILAGKKWKVFFLGAGSYGESNTLSFKPHPNISAKKISYCPGGWRQKFHYAWFCILAFSKALWWRPEWVYASDLNSCPAALLLSYLPDIKVIYHEHDSLNTENHSKSMSIFLWFRKRLLKRIRHYILPNIDRAMWLDKDERNKIMIMKNYPRLEEAGSSPKKHISDKFRIYYHGSIGGKLFPITIIKALSLLPADIRLLVIGYETIGSIGYAQTLIREAERLGILERVEMAGAMPRREMMLQCRDADIGLALMPKDAVDINLRYLLGASNKPFDYMACGLALLVSDLPDWRSMYVNPGYALACDPDDPESIAKALRWFIEHPQETREIGERGRQKILAEWNYEKQFEPVLKILEAEGTSARGN